MADRILTGAQRAQLAMLYTAKARDLASAIDVYRQPRLNPVVIGKLRDLGLADSQVVRPPGGAQRTNYWLTPAGLEAAERLGEAPHG